MGMFYTELQKTHPEIAMQMYGDCHLTDNLHLSRVEGDIERAQLLCLMWQEGVIDESFFFIGLENSEVLKAVVPNDKPIVLTGKMYAGRTSLTSLLNNNGYTVLDAVKPGAWLWMGEKVGASKVEKAKALGVEYTPIRELVKTYTEL
jgi:NAD-dependent DNA ligase